MGEKGGEREERVLPAQGGTRIFRTSGYAGIFIILSA
jgi:hypothetical protein